MFEGLIEPREELLDRDDRRRARLVAAVVLTIVPVGLITSAIRLGAQPSFLPTFLSNVVVLVVLGALGFVARTRHYRTAAGLASAMIVLAGALSGWWDASDPAWWAFEILGVLLATVLISLRGAIAVALFALVCVIVVELLHGQPPSAWIGPVMFHLVMSPMLLVLAHLRNLIEDDRRRHREALAKQLHEAQRLEAVGRIAGGVAHDFNNLLTVVTASCHTARDTTDRDELEEVLQEIEHASERGRLLVQQLLAFSRKQVLSPAPLRLSRVASDMHPVLVRLVGKEKLTLSLHGDEGAELLADRSQIEQVLLNLVVNAEAATTEEEHIELRTGVVERGPADSPVEDQQCAFVVVADDGKGMSEEVRQRMFEPFFTSRAAEGGTGLGLATVHGVVHQSGGHIEVQSVVGEGTTFRLFFPVAEAVEEAADAEPRGARSLQILLVDDEPAVRRSVARLLTRLGHEVRAASGADEAHTIWDEHGEDIDVVLSDIVMPGVDGLTLVKDLQRDRPDVHVVLMSGFSAATAGKHGADSLDVPLLRKPFSQDELTAALSD